MAVQSRVSMPGRCALAIYKTTSTLVRSSCRDGSMPVMNSIKQRYLMNTGATESDLSRTRERVDELKDLLCSKIVINDNYQSTIESLFRKKTKTRNSISRIERLFVFRKSCKDNKVLFGYLVVTLPILIAALTFAWKIWSDDLFKPALIYGSVVGASLVISVLLVYYVLLCIPSRRYLLAGIYSKKKKIDKYDDELIENQIKKGENEIAIKQLERELDVLKNDLLMIDGAFNIKGQQGQFQQPVIDITNGDILDSMAEYFSILKVDFVKAKKQYPKLFVGGIVGVIFVVLLSGWWGVSAYPISQQARLNEQREKQHAINVENEIRNKELDENRKQDEFFKAWNEEINAENEKYAGSLMLRNYSRLTPGESTKSDAIYWLGYGYKTVTESSSVYGSIRSEMLQWKKGNQYATMVFMSKGGEMILTTKSETGLRW